MQSADDNVNPPRIQSADDNVEPPGIQSVDDNVEPPRIQSVEQRAALVAAERGGRGELNRVAGEWVAAGLAAEPCAERRD